MVVNSIRSCDIDIRKVMYHNIIVAGGCSLLTGFNERLLKSISKLIPSRDINVKMMSPKNRRVSCWIGGATVSSLKAFNRMWITKKDFNEEGKRILFERDI
mmetsp:Transcript_5321/g.8970  ORF Transcript_5321/g.8970 Transcript_5321/m.8970 type:complete len:101 (+) Transcript_5321:889-1191(+)